MSALSALARCSRRTGSGPSRAGVPGLDLDIRRRACCLGLADELRGPLLAPGEVVVGDVGVLPGDGGVGAAVLPLVQIPSVAAGACIAASASAHQPQALARWRGEEAARTGPPATIAGRSAGAVARPWSSMRRHLLPRDHGLWPGAGTRGGRAFLRVLRRAVDRSRSASGRGREPRSRCPVAWRVPHGRPAADRLVSWGTSRSSRSGASGDVTGASPGSWAELLLPGMRGIGLPCTGAVRPGVGGERRARKPGRR